MIVKCSCGCGKEFVPSRSTQWRLRTGRIQEVFLQGHSGRGALNRRWSGGKSMSSQGYLLVRAPECHPNARVNGYILEHRFVMSQTLGRPLRDDEIVHHINGNKTDNRPENLKLVTRQSHKILHPEVTTRIERAPKICEACGASFTKNDAGNHKRAKYCSTACRNAPGNHHPRRKISIETEQEIARQRKVPRKELAQKYGISESHVKKLRSKYR